MTAYQYIRPLWTSLFLDTEPTTTRTHSLARIASAIVAAARVPSGRRLSRRAPPPTDNWIRDDIGLPRVSEAPLLPERRLTLPAPSCFPTDDRLRDDIGLPPLGNGSGVDDGH